MHRFWRGRFFDEVRSTDLARTLLVVGLLAVGQHFGLTLEVLLCHDDRECVTKSLVLDNRSVADTLILADDAVGKRDTLPAQFHRPVWIVGQLHVLAGQFLCNFAPVQDDLLPVVGHRQLGTDVALFAMA